MDLHYSDGIAAARTMIAVEASAGALQRRLPSGWELTPYAGDDQRGTALRGANVLVPFHEVYAVRTREGRSIGLPQLSYSAFVSPARNRATGAVGHVHWFTSTEDAAGVPGNTATPRSPAQRQRLLVDRGSVALGDGGGVWTLSR